MRRESRKKEKVVWKYNVLRVVISLLYAIYAIDGLRLQVEDIYVEKGVHHTVIELKNRQSVIFIEDKAEQGWSLEFRGELLILGRTCLQPVRRNEKDATQAALFKQ